MVPASSTSHQPSELMSTKIAAAFSPSTFQASPSLPFAPSLVAVTDEDLIVCHTAVQLPAHFAAFLDTTLQQVGSSLESS